MAIRILDAATSARIAAGEVVERPSSVAKEWMENALDAGATAMTVEIRDGGISYLRVTDNGCGIPASEARLAFENHATSKLTKPEDLNDIRTLGFRGEALPSIAAVSKIECTTRARGQLSGVRLTIEGGRFIGMTEAGCPEGTTMILRDLFFNTPVRQAFLKKPGYEGGVLTDMVARVILANPGVGIRLIAAGKTVYHSFGDNNLRHAALAVYGKEIAEQLIAVDQMAGGMHLSGLIGVGDCARATRSGESFFINGRVVRAPLLTQALEQACRGRLTIGLYPLCALSLTLPPQGVDVNVHPNKLEVRFRDEAGVRAQLDELFARCFEGEHMLPSFERRIETPAPPVIRVTHVDDPIENKPTPVYTEPASNLDQAPAPKPLALHEDDDCSARIRITVTPPPQDKPIPVFHLGDDGRMIQTMLAPSTVPNIEKQTEVVLDSPDPAADVPQYRILGVALATYLLIECQDALWLIDQHAAHERILYERYMKALDDGRAVQPLLTPVILPASKREIAQIMAQQDALLAAGFEVEPFGERDLQLRAVPMILGRASVQPVFMQVVDRLDTLKYATLEKRRTEIIQTACKHAVKAGDRLSDGEIRALIDEMARTGACATCPHGRPVVRVLGKSELERLFKRQQ